MNWKNLLVIWLEIILAHYTLKNILKYDVEYGILIDNLTFDKSRGLKLIIYLFSRSILKAVPSIVKESIFLWLV